MTETAFDPEVQAQIDALEADAIEHIKNNRPERAQQLRDEADGLRANPPAAAARDPKAEKDATIRAEKLAERVSELEAENDALKAVNDEASAALVDANERNVALQARVDELSIVTPEIEAHEEFQTEDGSWTRDPEAAAVFEEAPDPPKPDPGVAAEEARTEAHLATPDPVVEAESVDTSGLSGIGTPEHTVGDAGAAKAKAEPEPKPRARGRGAGK